MSKGGKVPHKKMTIPNDGTKKSKKFEEINAHIHDTKKDPTHKHGLKAASSTRAANHSQKNG